MAYDPGEPRDANGRWVGGGARGHNAGGGNRSIVDHVLTQHQQDVALSVGKGIAKGIAEGIAVSAAVGVVTGGFGAIATPALITGAAARGAVLGARHGLSTAHVVLGTLVGGHSGLEEHRARIKAEVVNEHKKG